MAHGILRVRIHDSSEDAVRRLPEHILRAQRYAWCCDGFFLAPEKEPVPNEDGLPNFPNQIEIENLGRIAAYNRQIAMLDFFDPETSNTKVSPNPPQSDMHDCTIEVSDMSEGSLIVEICIPLAGVIALCLARLYAKDRNNQREFDARMRVIEAVDRQLIESGISKKEKGMLLKRLIDGIGAFDSRIVEEMTVELLGQKLSIRSEAQRLPNGKSDEDE